MLAIEPLGPQHDRAGFTCGEADLDDWFRERAGQDEKRNLARVFVMSDADGVVGFYSLSSHTLALADLPTDLAKKLPRYDAIPAALIGRLARAERMRGQQVGETLLLDAIARTLSAAHAVAVHSILVDAKNERAAAFYARYGFKAFPLRPSRMFLLASTAAKAFKQR
ncbi:MAG: GNAT family N-acetyltransferase [Cypionkella sp.]